MHNGENSPDDDERDRIAFIEHFSWGACLTSIWHYTGKLDYYVIGQEA